MADSNMPARVRITPTIMIAQGVFMAVFCGIGMYLLDRHGPLWLQPAAPKPLAFYAAFGFFMGVTFPLLWAFIMRRLPLARR
jgi:hypothetical protein